MFTPIELKSWFDAAVPYGRYLATHAKPGERPRWDEFFARVSLTAGQAGLVRGFARRMPVLCVSGTWCGDCVQQVPILAKIAEASPAVDLRFLERDARMDVAERMKVCGGHRVPVLAFMNEDFEFVAFAGDRTLSRYRALAARQLGPSCPMPGSAVPADELAATVQDWVDEFERVALILRLSTKLRQRYGD
jgi:thiol-disulfide isomerase/thioredoxin